MIALTRGPSHCHRQCSCVCLRGVNLPSGRQSTIQAGARLYVLDGISGLIQKQVLRDTRLTPNIVGIHESFVDTCGRNGTSFSPNMDLQDTASTQLLNKDGELSSKVHFTLDGPT